MIAHYLPYLLVGLVGGFLGALTVALVAAQQTQRAPFPVVCGRCATEERHADQRRQLYLEVWDNRVMYAKWPVGRGELIGTRAVDGDLLHEVKDLVAQINAQQRALRLVSE